MPCRPTPLVQSRLSARLAQLFSPPLTLPYSRRGWRLARRLQPAADAPLAGAGAAPLSGGLPLGVWSLPPAARDTSPATSSSPPAALGALGEAVPPAPVAEAERCRAAGRLRPPKGVRVRLADLSLLCETVDASGWAPKSTWAPSSRVDGYPKGC